MYAQIKIFLTVGRSMPDCTEMPVAPGNNNKNKDFFCFYCFNNLSTKT